MNSPEGGLNRSSVADLYEEVANQPEEVESLMQRGETLQLSIKGLDKGAFGKEIPNIQIAITEILPKLKEAISRAGDENQKIYLYSQIQAFELFLRAHPIVKTE